MLWNAHNPINVRRKKHEFNIAKDFNISFHEILCANLAAIGDNVNQDNQYYFLYDRMDTNKMGEFPKAFRVYKDASKRDALMRIQVYTIKRVGFCKKIYNRQGKMYLRHSASHRI